MEVPVVKYPYGDFAATAKAKIAAVIAAKNLSAPDGPMRMDALIQYSVDCNPDTRMAALDELLAKIPQGGKVGFFPIEVPAGALGQVFEPGVRLMSTYKFGTDDVYERFDVVLGVQP